MPLLLGGGLLTFFLVIDRIYSLTDLVITKGVPFHLVLQLLVYMLPSFLAHTLPMALLVAILLAGGRLATDLEVVAFGAAGVSPLRLFRPVLIAALAVAAATATLTLVLIPASNTAFQRQLFKILQSRAATGLKERVFNTTFGDIVIYIEEVSASQVALRGILVSDERDPTTTRIVTAREGRLLTDEENRRITLRLLDGAINESDVVPTLTPRPSGAETFPEPVTSATTSGRYRYTAFGIYDMNLPLQAPFKGAARYEKPEKSLSTAGLRRAIKTPPAGEAPTAFRVEYAKRLALPFAALVFATVGFPLAFGTHRSGRSLALVGSLAILVTYYLVFSALEGLAQSQRLPVWLAIWLPNTAFAAVGGALLWMRVRGVRLPRARRVRDALGRVRVRRPWAWPGQLLDQGPRESRDSTHLIDRYVVRTWLGYFGMTLAVAAAIFVVVDLLRTLDRYLRVKPPLAYILEHFVWELPAGIYQGLPVVTLVATIFLFRTLSRYHELTALKTAGMSLYRVSLPVLALAAAMSIGAGLFQELALPTLNERGEELDNVRIRGQKPRHLQVRSRIWFRSADTRFYRLELLDPSVNDLLGVTILEIDLEFRLMNRLDAALAHWTSEGWELADGALREIGPGGHVQTIPFVATALDLPETMEDFTAIQKPVDAMSFVELAAYIVKLRESGHQVTKYLVELYSKLSAPLAHLVMALVAIPFAIQSPRGGRVVGIGLAIGILVGYLVVHYSALAFARAELLPPLMAAWTANVVFLGLGAAMLMRART
jgi:LPS export ABC transporter permease LptG